MARQRPSVPQGSLLAALAALVAVPALGHAQETTPPWIATQQQPQQVQPQAQPVMVAQPVQPSQPVVYVDAYGRPLGPQNGGPTYGTNFGGPPPGYGPEPQRAPVRLRGFMSANIGVIAFQSSPYRTASRAWGYDAFSTALNLAVEGGAHLHNAFLLGARVAWTNSNGGQASFDSASLTLNAFDFSVLARVGYPVPIGRGDWIFYPGFQVELGALYASTSLRGASSGEMMPRGAGQIALIFSDLHVGIGLRLGYQYAMWSNAAGSGESLALGGLLASLGLEVRL
ncbi:MAG: hypothetical protein WCJ30_04600 [Deltaproteobacteria bacterium]